MNGTYSECLAISPYITYFNIEQMKITKNTIVCQPAMNFHVVITRVIKKKESGFTPGSQQ